MGRSILEGVSDFISLADVKEPILLTIDDVQWEQLTDLKGKTEEKAVMSFKGAKKRLPINKTNARWLAEHYGDDSEGYTGRQVVLGPGTVGGNSGLFFSVPQVPAVVETTPVATQGDDYAASIPF